MSRGGKRAGAGRPKGSSNIKLVAVRTMLPALATEADRLRAACAAPEVAAVLDQDRGGGTLVEHVLMVEVGLTKTSRLTVRPSGL